MPRFVELTELAAISGDRAMEPPAAPGITVPSLIVEKGSVRSHAWTPVQARIAGAELTDVGLAAGYYPFKGDAITFCMMHNNYDVQEKFYVDRGLLGRLMTLPEEKSASGIGEPVVLLGGHHDNLWHLFHNFILRLWSAERFYGPELREKGYLVVRHDIREPYYEIFEMLGYPRSRIIPAPATGTARFDRLYVSEIPFYNAVGRVGIAPQTITVFDRLWPSRGSGKRRIFISREDAKWRRILNEREVRAMLETKGFETIVLSKMTMAEILSLHADAEIVIGPSGANLAPTIFCRPGTTVVELSYPPMVTKYYFDGTSAMRGLRHIRVSGPPEEPDKPFFTNFSTPLSDLEMALELAMESAQTQ